MTRVPPANIEAEQALLGCILLNQDVLDLIADWLPVEAFFIRKHQKLYKAFLDFREQGKDIGLIEVLDWFNERHELEEAGGMTFITRLLNTTVSSTNADRYAMLIHDKFLRRQIIKLGGEIVEIGYDPDLESVEAYEQIAKLLPPGVTNEEKPKKQIKVTKLKFSMPTPLHPDSRIELEANDIDIDHLEQAYLELSSLVMNILRSNLPTKEKTPQTLDNEES